jgi:hypothetical protein
MHLGFYFREDTTMKKFALACAAVVLFAAAAQAGEKAIAKSTLGSMGLGSMQVMSDNDGLAVRGKGTSAAVWGGSIAAWHGGQQSANNYEAAAAWIGKNSVAVGGSLSFAGKVEVLFAQDPTGSQLQVSAQAGVSGGAAFAAAF